MVKKEDVKESTHGQSGVTLIHIPTGCHVEASMSDSREVNRAVAMRLLKSKLANWEPVPRGLF